MKALLLIAHGSRNQNAKDEIYELTRSLRSLTENSSEQKFEMVDCAFLELVNPDIETGIAKLVREGAAEITVLPYFLAKGNHVNNDIPEKLSRAQALFPNISIELVPHIGKAPNILDLVLGHLHYFTKRDC